jgi:ribosome-binding factor A
VTGRRPERLAGEMREEIARMIAFELKDPRLGFVTVTRVELAHDLRYARVHVGVMGSDAERDKSLAALKSAAGFVRRKLGRRLRIHHTPEIDFRYDKGIDATDRVARLLAEEDERQRSQRDAGGDGGEEGGGRASGPPDPHDGGPSAGGSGRTGGTGGSAE